jgi:hypothetical protein
MEVRDRRRQGSRRRAYREKVRPGTGREAGLGHVFTACPENHVGLHPAAGRDAVDGIIEQQVLPLAKGIQSQAN